MLVTLTVLGLALGCPSPRAQDLAEAARLLEEHLEPEMRRGAEACARANNVAGVELLLDVLRRVDRPSSRHLAPAHYRDIAFESLERITDPYARARVEAELQRNRQDPRVRQWCAELLGHYRDGAFGGTLLKALDDADLDVQRWAARSLGQLQWKPATEKLRRRLTHKDPILRANALEALARVEPAASQAAFLQALTKDPDAGARCALLGALPEIYPDEVEAAAVGARKDPDWRPRLQAVDNLASVKTKTGVDALVLALDDGRPVVGSRASATLQALTGQKIRDAATWKLWWRDNRESFAFPEAKTTKSAGPPSTVAYMGIDLTSDHVAFLIDKSIQMARSLDSKGMPKDEAARQELEAALARLHGKLVFNVHMYAEEVTSLSKEPMKLTPASQKKALAFLEAKPNGRQKDIWQVLETVLADPDIDTAYLLSSGEPDTGLYVHWNRVTSHLRDRNRFRKLVVHTVAYSEVKWFRDQLEKIAEVTKGEFRWFE